MKTFLSSSLVWFVITALPWSCLQAQQTAPSEPQNPPSAQQVPQPKPEAPADTTPPTNNEEILKKEESQRILGVVPQFGVTSRHNAPPLTPGQKFHLFAKSAFDPAEFVLVGLQAGISQGEDEFPGYGQGAAGYGKRYGASLADEVSAGFWSNFFYPTLLKEDPRYFRLGEGTIKHRLGYALAQEFVCHTDKGGRSFAFSNVLGALSAGGLSNLYYPESDRGFGLTMSRSGIALMYGSIGGLVDEFWPDISGRLFHKRQKNGQAQ